MQRRHFLKNSALGLVLSLLFPFRPFRAFAQSSTPAPETTSFCFGSCLVQDHPQPVWNAVAQKNPDFFVFLGDNIYSDSYDPAHIKAQYEKWGAIPEFIRFKKKVPLFATWDDHDYGVNDIGYEFSQKEASRTVMLDFFGEPQDSPRRKRSGIYQSYTFGESPRKVQLILLDLRWNRTPLNIVDDKYVPHTEPGATMLGEEQWQWLEEELRKPADFRILASSLQLVSSEHRWEKWANYPEDKARLWKILESEKIQNLVAISGDMHYGEISQEISPTGLSLIDLTSSGLNRFESAAEFSNAKRLALFDNGVNFGWIEIDWITRTAHLRVCDEAGTVRIQYSLVIEGEPHV